MISIEQDTTKVNPKEIAEAQLGPIDWFEELKGYCTCPGEDTHSGKTGDTDCIVYLDGAANISCFHQSCFEERMTAGKALRQALAAGNVDSDAGIKVDSKEQKARQQQEMRKHLLELRANRSLPLILKNHKWIYADIQKDSPTALPESEVENSWKHVLALFKPEDVVWIGNTFDSGKVEHQRNFRSAQEWLTEPTIPGQFTCPATFKNSIHSRSNENVLARRFLVIESDILTKDQVGAIFKWLKDEVGLNLRAVVDTAGKSLHGWFDYPKKAILEELEIILPQLGCDPGLFRASQPCRIPGVMRNGKYQSLVYLQTEGKGRSPKQPSSVFPLPDLYYDGSGTTYWRANDSGGWQKINERSLELELMAQGYGTKPQGTDPLTPVQRTKRDIQIKQDVVYAGPLAGCSQGFREVAGQRILVTQSPKIIEPKAGEWKTLRQLFENLFKNDTVDQTPYLYGWFKSAYQSLRTGKHTPGQCLAVAGPPNAGKSLIQNIATAIFGGRAAKPYQFMTGKTAFNAELFGAEHLMIEDESASTDIRTRTTLGAFIKMITVNRTQSCHGKNKQALTLTPWWRLTISVNEEPEHLMVLPPMDDSVKDKIILLKAFRQPMPMPTETSEEKAAFWAQLESELPAFLAFLEEYQIPNELRDERFGVKTFHNPELLTALSELQPEIRLLNIIDSALVSIRADHERKRQAEHVYRRG